jgi:DNA-binding MarR family transcriptional regulator
MQKVLSGIMPSDTGPTARRSPKVLGIGFLLSQLGAHSAAAFAGRIAPLGLTPPHVGVLAAIARQPGRSQQAIADEFGVPPSRMVALIDELEARGLVERRRDDSDRRVHLLHLSDAGGKTLGEVAALGQDAERELLTALTVTERRELAERLTRIADQQGLRRGVHPGYHRLRSGSTDCPPG